MNIVKKGLLILVSILVVNYSFDCLWFYLKPKYNGQLELKSIQETTTVYFDEYGIPHIYAANAKDAMVALGYVHAQDRLWQMELMRRIAQGACRNFLEKWP
jgi:penicillin amidase